MVDSDDPRPAYVQIADDVADQIRDGRLAPGGRLPSMSQLMDRHGVTRMTVRQALGVLRDRQLVVSAPRRGVFVVEGADAVEAPEPAAEVPASLDEAKAMLEALNAQVAEQSERIAKLERQQGQHVATDPGPSPGPDPSPGRGPGD